MWNCLCQDYYSSDQIYLVFIPLGICFGINCLKYFHNSLIFFVSISNNSFAILQQKNTVIEII